MSLVLRRRAELLAGEVAGLEEAMAKFYRNPPAEYYQTADEAAGGYTARERPFHLDLANQVSGGMKVLEVGCGTAHLCPYVEERGGTFTGIDYSEELLAQNRRRFPRARFFQITDRLDEQFDLVASLYALEHVVDPPAYLERLWNYCRPGGLVGIACPEFMREWALSPSVYYGCTPGRLRDKVRKLHLLDAIWHVVELKISRPLWKARLRRSQPGSFWINLRPRVLHGAPYAIDADAVHLTGLRDLTWFFQQKGAAIVRTSEGMRDVPPDVLRYNCYLLARKQSV